MSGGSLDYVYQKVMDAADEIDVRKDITVLQKQFATHLRLVAIALHDLEWVYSDDYSPGDEVPAITRVLLRDSVQSEDDK